MVAALARLSGKLLGKLGLEIRSTQPPSSERKFSNLDEQLVIAKHLKSLGLSNSGQCVDIAASDGVSMSNTCALYQQGWSGLAAEFSPELFSSLASNYRHFHQVNLAKCKVTPDNVLALLSANEIASDFDFLNLDIDGYDHFVLEALLDKYRPKLICAEVNEKIPPPIKFTVKWDPSYCWHEDHFFGQSLSQLHGLATKHRYSLVELHYNNAFLIPAELSPEPSLAPSEAYRVGYKEKSDRKTRFPWNHNVEELLDMSPEDGLEFLNKLFAERNGMYEASI